VRDLLNAINIKEAMGRLLLIESLVNSGLNYEDPKVAKSIGH